MPESEKSAEQLAVAVYHRVAYVRLRDRGSFKISKSLKEFGIAAIEQGAEKLVVDMTDCVGMDSTFMGVLAGLAFRLKKKSAGTVSMVNLSARTRGLLATLGLDQLVETHMQGATPPEFVAMLEQRSENITHLAHPDASRRETAEMMLEAHENLVQASAENLPRFRDVLTFLREDIKKADPDPAENLASS